MPMIQENTPKKRLVIEASAVRDLEVSDAKRDEPAQLEMAPNPGNFG